MEAIIPRNWGDFRLSCGSRKAIVTPLTMARRRERPYLPEIRNRVGAGADRLRDRNRPGAFLRYPSR